MMSIYLRKRVRFQKKTIRQIPVWEKEYYKAQKFIFQGKYKKAITIYQRIIKKYPEDKRSEYLKDKYLLFQIGLCYEELYQFLDASKLYLELIKKYQEDDNFIKQVKYRCEFLEKYKLVEIEEKRKEEKISEVDYLIKVGYAFMQDGKENAMELIEKAFKLDPENPEALLRWGEICDIEGNNILHYNDCVGGEEYVRGQLYKENARSMFKKVIMEYPNSKFVDEAQHLLGCHYCDSIFLNDNDYYEAIKEFEILLKKYHKSKFALKAQYKIAKCYEMLEDYQQAFKEYKKTIEKFPAIDEAITARRSLGYLYIKMKNYEKALVQFREIINNFPEAEEARLALLDIAYVYENFLKDYHKAIEIYEIYLDNYETDREIDREFIKQHLKELKKYIR
ncbi:TPA: hypothetical protein DCX16_06655 [bacterium]|nr:hypothetical protein [bacterium]